MIALCDATSFYACAEKSLDPSIRQRPVLVFSNNDGCCVALCPIAKRLGFKKFMPMFQMKDDIRRYNAVVRSSNYELYADISSKMFSLLNEYTDELYEYSIDEGFMRFDNTLSDEQWVQLGLDIRKALWRQLRIPIGVGFGVNCTLAKAANHASKKLPGFNGSAIVRTDQHKRHVLTQMETSDVWGIGSRLEKRLGAMGIKNGFQLAQQNPSKMRKYFSITLENTVRELQGEVRLSWDDVRPAKKEIYSTRSFGQRVSSIEELKSALVSHAEIAASKLRAQNSVAGGIVLFAANSPHDDEPYQKKTFYTPFEVPTSDTRNIIGAISSSIGSLFVPQLRYYKVGVGLVDLKDSAYYQHDLFSQCTDNPALMNALDTMNARFGRDTISFAAKGFKQGFAMRRNYLSKRYTTRIHEIPRIKC